MLYSLWAPIPVIFSKGFCVDTPLSEMEDQYWLTAKRCFSPLCTVTRELWIVCTDGEWGEASEHDALTGEYVVWNSVLRHHSAYSSLSHRVWWPCSVKSARNRFSSDSEKFVQLVSFFFVLVKWFTEHIQSCQHGSAILLPRRKQRRWCHHQATRSSTQQTCSGIQKTTEWKYTASSQK